jgi:predicted alpha/beta superfamily hydrolase
LKIKLQILKYLNLTTLYHYILRLIPKSITWCLLAFILVANTTFAQLTIRVTDVPENTLTADNIYLASSLSNWNPGDSTYKLLKKEDKTYQITFNPPIGKIEFKFTRGSWSTVESNEEGVDISNRVLDYDGSSQSMNVSIVGWKEEKIKKSTATENVSILKEDFYMPGLERERKVWIYLPPDYNTSQKTYPVLYMNDGQNLFDDTSSYSGEWGVDEMLNKLFEEGDEGVIVIGIENGRSARIEEYTPWVNDKYGGGRGEEYIEFIVAHLKPYIDAHYRSKLDRLHTGIMGSSLGGLISFYAAIEHQDVFGKAGVFSPSFWFSPEIYNHVEKTGKQHDMEFYLLGGELEGEYVLQDLNKMKTTLQIAGFNDSEIKIVSKADGDHNEAFWTREFSDCYRWLFRN